MAIKGEGTNTGSKTLGRGGYAFPPGETVPIEVGGDQFREIYLHPDIKTVVTHADNANDVPSDASDYDVEVQLNASKGALNLAEERGASLWGIEGTGKNGQILKEDVERALEPDPATARDFVPSSGTHRATTLDPPTQQAAAQREAIQTMERGAVSGALPESSPDRVENATPAGEQTADQTNPEGARGDTEVQKESHT